MRKRTRSPQLAGTLRPETAAGGLLTLVEADSWSSGLPGAGQLAASACARGFYASTLHQQWEILHVLFAEHAEETEDPQHTLRAFFAAADPRVRCFVPGAWTRLARNMDPADALAQLRAWCADADVLLADFLPAFGLRPWAERLGPEILPLLMPWARDADPAVRRAVIVALRPRGTWVAHLSWAIETPSLLAPFFDVLRTETDPSVAGALANALNDVSHTSPELVLALLHRWREDGAGALHELIARRALRSLLKAGDARALQALGLPELRVELQVHLRGAATVAPNSSLVFDLEVHNLGAAAAANLVYEVETTGKLVGRPRRQRVQAGTYFLPAEDRVRLIVRERIFDRRSARLMDGPGCVRFFLNGEECASCVFELRRS